MTEIDVINQCLASMALAPISSGEVASHPYAQAAQQKLDDTTKDVLAKGWWYNERLITSSLPSDLLRVEGAGGRVLSLRAGAIYDHGTQTTLTNPYPAQTLGYVLLPFDDLPAALQAYVAALTVVAFQAELDGSDAKLKQHSGEVARSLAVVQEIDRNSRVRWSKLWEMLSYGWWFNTVEFTVAADGTGAPTGALAVCGPPGSQLQLDKATGLVKQTWTGELPGRIYERARAYMQVLPGNLPVAAAEWLARASAIIVERESLSPDPRVLAELQRASEDSWGVLRQEGQHRAWLRDASREVQASGWWFNTVPLADAIIGTTPDFSINPLALKARSARSTNPVSLRWSGAELQLWDHQEEELVDLADPPENVAVVLELPFEELPVPAQEYIRTVSRMANAGGQELAILRSDAQRQLRELQHTETSIMRANIGRWTSVQRALYDIRTGGASTPRVPIR